MDLFIEQWFSTSLEHITKLQSRRQILHENMLQLKALELPGQRSPEWYQMKRLLTASSLADALGKEVLSNARWIVDE